MKRCPAFCGSFGIISLPGQSLPNGGTCMSATLRSFAVRKIDISRLVLSRSYILRPRSDWVHSSSLCIEIRTLHNVVSDWASEKKGKRGLLSISWGIWAEPFVLLRSIASNFGISSSGVTLAVAVCFCYCRRLYYWVVRATLAHGARRHGEPWNVTQPRQ